MKIHPVVLESRHVRLESMREAHADGLVAAGVGLGLFRFFPFSLETESEMRAWVLGLLQRDRERMAGREAWAAQRPDAASGARFCTDEGGYRTPLTGTSGVESPLSFLSSLRAP